MKKEKNVKVLNYWDWSHFSSRLSSSVIHVLINSTRILARQTDLLKKMPVIWLSTSGGLTRKLTQKWLMSFNNLEWTYWLCVQSNDIFVIIIIQQIYLSTCVNAHWLTLKQSIVFFLNNQKERKDTLLSELVFTRSRDIDFPLYQVIFCAPCGQRYQF